jgi:DNA-binding CsgD family transcriptional regulator
VRLHAAQFEEAARLFGEELAMAEERGLEAIEVLARFHLAEVQTRAGDWAAALANSRLAAEHARQATHAQSSSASTYALAAVEALLGNHAAARSLSSEGLSRAESIRDPWYATLHRAVLAFVALAEDDAPSAIELLEPAWATMRERGIGNPSIFPVAHVLGEALAATGRDEETLAVARELRALPGAVHPWSRAMASRCEALVASSGGDHHTARAAIDEALAAHTHLSEPFELARTLHIQGRIERRARSWAGARKALESALVRFDTLGAARWAENTATDFARLPGRRPTADGELTATERRVAALVAEGLSNKEAAARLFVSVRAVEANLSRIYAKLGIRSRAGLAARLRRSAG